jgi:carboxylesterase
MTAPIKPGCEPLSAEGNATGILVIHGFTGSPVSMRPLATRFVDAGYSVELVLLPGHGTSLEEMKRTGFADWSQHVEHCYETLAARTERVFVIGLSMGGLLTCWLAQRHQDIAGIVVINPLIESLGSEIEEGVSALIEAGMDETDGIGSDIAKERVNESSYHKTPLVPLLSMLEAAAVVSTELSTISCPVLCFRSSQDHILESSHSDLLMASVAGPAERIILENSYHVATMDYDAELIETQALAFVERLVEEQL